MEIEFTSDEASVSKEIPIPALRLFAVRRVAPGTSIVEKIVVEAHTVEYGEGGVLAFYTLTPEPAARYGVTQRMHRIFHDWIDMEALPQAKFSPLAH